MTLLQVVVPQANPASASAAWLVAVEVLAVIVVDDGPVVVVLIVLDLEVDEFVVVLVKAVPVPEVDELAEPVLAVVTPPSAWTAT